MVVPWFEFRRIERVGCDEQSLIAGQRGATPLLGRHLPDLSWSATAHFCRAGERMVKAPALAGPPPRLIEIFASIAAASAAAVDAAQEGRQSALLLRHQAVVIGKHAPAATWIGETGR
jgi:hypothetical protein